MQYTRLFDNARIANWYPLVMTAHLIEGASMLFRYNTCGALAQVQEKVELTVSRGQPLTLFAYKVLATNNHGGLGDTPPVDGNEVYNDDFLAMLDYA